MTTSSSPAPSRETAPEATRPRLIDYLLIWLGVGLSALLAEMTGVHAGLREGTQSAWSHATLQVLPIALFLPVGVILFWPIFYAGQWLTRRRSGLTLGEWLLGVAWLAALAFAGWAFAKGAGALPEYLQGDDFKKHAVLGYILFMVSVGILAVVLWLVGLITRLLQPWTHTFGLALLIWPSVPLLAVWLGNIKLM